MCHSHLWKGPQFYKQCPQKYSKYFTVRKLLSGIFSLYAYWLLRGHWRNNLTQNDDQNMNLKISGVNTLTSKQNVILQTFSNSHAGIKFYNLIHISLKLVLKGPNDVSAIDSGNGLVIICSMIRCSLFSVIGRRTAPVVCFGCFGVRLLLLLF